MFAYCLNNPVNGCDPCGTCFHRLDFWNDCEDCGGKTIDDKLNKMKNDIDNLWKETKETAKALYDNVEVSAGVGMGFEVGIGLVDFLGLQLGMHGNVIEVKHEKKSMDSR